MIAIIAVLASMLLPALSLAREQARVTTCTNNLKQLGLGVQLYADSNDDHIPGHRDWGGTRTTAWEAAVMDAASLNSALVFRCPSDPIPLKGGTTSSLASLSGMYARYNSFNVSKRSYGFSYGQYQGTRGYWGNGSTTWLTTTGTMVTTDSNLGWLNGARISRVSSPEVRVLIGDRWNPGKLFWANYAGVCERIQRQLLDGVGQNGCTWHPGGSNNPNCVNDGSGGDAAYFAGAMCHESPPLLFVEGHVMKRTPSGYENNRW